MKRVLTIAGSDSGGGAGIQADLKAITLLGGFGMSVLTALTAQNTVAVTSIHDVPLEFIAAQIDAVFSDIGVDAVKTGMLSNTGVVKLVASKMSEYKPSILVVDPVMVAKSGDPLLAADARQTLAEFLLPEATMVTPNLPEASALAGWEVATEREMRIAAEKIHALGPKYVLVKGGHLQGEAVDLLFDGREFHEFRSPRIETKNVHGTGCTYASAIATYLAQELEVVEAVAAAKRFITEAILHGLSLGKGHGPTNPYAAVRKEWTS
ncbi:MAG: bifunctional hydroxymethylpyrimidine kinase/phosphomethylpyrimidine kinase [Deltaproteobacteria bacterium]|nr:bifunctional hydroxymethylpyrimidine kinase/phosphomethylpyrimidine kinase [Deltaproteobacteria bacterium]